MQNDGIKAIVPLEKGGLEYEFIQSISKSNDGIYFIGAANGVFLYDPDSFRSITSYEGMPIPNNWTRGIHDIALDRDGFLWAVSGWEGVYKLNEEMIVEHFNIFHGLNAIKAEDVKITDPILNEQLDSKLELPFFQNLTSRSKLYTLHYIFKHIRTGEFLSIKNVKVAYFIPFYNVGYENTWHNL